MTSILGFGFDAELDYRRERLRADFRRVHGSDRRRWWQRRRTDRVAELSTPIRTRSIHGVDAMGVITNSGVTNSGVTDSGVTDSSVTDSSVTVARSSVHAVVAGSRSTTTSAADDHVHPHAA